MSSKILKWIAAVHYTWSAVALESRWRTGGFDQSGYSVPTPSGTMAKVDSKGRIVLPKELRERLGITPGSEVAIHEEDGKAVVEPEDDPKQIIERMEQLIEETSSQRGQTTPLDDGADPIAQKHRDAVRRAAEKHSDE